MKSIWLTIYIFFQIHRGQLTVTWRAKSVQASTYWTSGNSSLSWWKGKIVNATAKLFYSSGQNQSKQANDPVDWFLERRWLSCPAFLSVYCLRMTRHCSCWKKIELIELSGTSHGSSICSVTESAEVTLANIFNIVTSVRAHLQLEKHGLSQLFSLKLWTLRPPSRQSGTLGSLLLRI